MSYSFTFYKDPGLLVDSIKLISIYYFISGLSVGTDSPKLGDRFSFKELG